MKDNNDNEIRNAESESPLKSQENTMEEQRQESKQEKRKAKRKAKKAAKKEKRKAKRAAKREAYRSLSAKKKVFYCMRRIAAVLLAAVLLIGIGKVASGYMKQVMVFLLLRYRDYLLTQDVSEETLLEMAPVDRALSEKVDAIKPYDKDDTWAVYVYICGSNLEGGTMNNLSDFSYMILQEYGNAIHEENTAHDMGLLTKYLDELADQGMDVPYYMYYTTPMLTDTSEDQPTEPAVVGSATADIEEMSAAELSDKIKIVIQTGGSNAWKSPIINPNRSQRFMIDKNGMRLLEDNHFANMGDPETLSDFFRFCEKTAPADHKIVVFWDHGGGAFGFGWDDLYGSDHLTLKEMRQAFADVYPDNPDNPAFEVVGFDACLMASLEVAESIHGYGRYLAASEEIEPGFGWDHTAWLGALSENPTFNGAQVGRAIADSFVETYARRNANELLAQLAKEVTFSVLDINEAHEAYVHYCDLADVALKDAIDDMDTLAAFGKAARQTVRFAESAYDLFNMVDFSNMIENLADRYPRETGIILDDIDRAVVYNRTTKALKDSGGISVYFPADVPNADSLLYSLQYIEDICLDDSIRALYYYKISGCLNDELQAYADSLGYGKAKKLDNTALRLLAEGEVVIDSDSSRFSQTLPEDAEQLIQEKMLYVSMLDGEDAYVDFGEDGLITVEDGKMVSAFDGRWLFMEGNALPLERVGASAGTIKYRTTVQHEGMDSYMMLSVDEKSGKVDIIGIYDLLGDQNDAVAERNIKQINIGDEFRVMYKRSDFELGGDTWQYGPKFTYKANTKIGYEKVRDGKYIAAFSVYDMRGDSFYSPVVQYEIKGGKIVSIEKRNDLIASASE